jgi:hypothetical protein
LKRFPASSLLLPGLKPGENERGLLRAKPCGRKNAVRAD